MSNENLMIEVVGSSDKAVNALDKVISKLTELQNKFISVTPVISQFNSSLKSISNNFSLKNIISDAVKASSEFQKMQSQNTIASAKAQSAMSKAAFDTEKYAFKSEKLAKAREKVAEAERRIAENAKWNEQAKKSLDDAVKRAIEKMRLQSTTASADEPTSRKTQYKDYYANRNIASEVNAINQVISPTIDTSKFKIKTQEIEAFINKLTPAIENMSYAAQNKFSKMADKLREVNLNLEKQKQIYNNLLADYKTNFNTWGADITSKLGIDKKLETTKESINKLTLESDNLKKAMQELVAPTKDVSSSLDKASKSANKSRNSFSLFNRVMSNLKTYILAGAIYKLSNAFSSAIQNCMNFNENMNLFDVAMGKNVNRAGEFVDKMSAAFGMDSSNLVRTMGTFYQIATSMGLTSQNAYVLSENFTKLANDLSSFYNISVSDATVKLQAGLVGETEPLRRLGIIITENALKQTAANLGIQKSIRSMSEAEKIHLRYITALEQTKNAQGDFARTIMAPAQSVKILKEQISQLSRAIGAVFMPILGTVLPYIIAFTRALTTLIKGLSGLVGYKPPEYQDLSSGFSVAANNANNLGTKASDATKKIKELKKQVMSFDELHILTKPTDTGSNGSSGGVGAGDFAVPDLTGYDNLMDSVGTKTDELYQKFMSAFEAIGNALEPTRQALSRLGVELERLKGFAWDALKDFYYSFLVPVSDWVLGNGLPRFIDILTIGLSQVNWGKINSSLHDLWIALTPFAVTVGEGLLWFWENVLVRIGTWTLNNAVPTFLNLLSGAINFLTPVISACMPLIDWLWNNFLWPIASFTGGTICEVLNGIAGGLSAVGDWMSNNQGIVTAMAATIGIFFAAWKLTELMAFIQMSGGIIGAFSSIGKAIAEVTLKKLADKAETIALTAIYAKDFLLSIVKSTAELGKQIISWGILTAAKIWDAVKTIAQTVATSALTAAQWLLNIAMSANPIALIIIAITALVAGLILLWNNCADFRNFCIASWESIVSACQIAWDWISRLFTEWIPSAFNTVIEWIKTNWQGLLLLILNPFVGAFKLIYDNCEGFRNFIDNLVASVSEFFSNLWSDISNWAINCWNSIISIWSIATGWFSSNIIDPINNFFSSLWFNIANFASGCWSGILNVWNTSSNWFKNNVISPIQNLFSSLWSGIKNIFGSVASWFGNIFLNAKNAIQNAFSGVTNFFSNMWNTIRNMFTNIGSTIGNAIGGAFRNVVNSIINFAENTINSFIRSINRAIGVINNIPGVSIGYIGELRIPRLAKGGLATDSVFANIGEGQYDEAVLPLNDAVFERLAKGINRNNADSSTTTISEESLYRAFLRALNDAPNKTATFIATLNNKIIAKEVVKEQNNQERRFNPIKA